MDWRSVGETMRLPNGDRAFVSIDKLVDYCLNPNHPRGRHKARVFAAALGIGTDEAEELRSALLAAAASGDAAPTEIDAYGQRFVLDLKMEGLAGQRTVRSLW